MLRPPLLVIATMAATIAACAQPPDRTNNAVDVQRDTVGDTVFVRTVSGSVWGGRVGLEEDLRIGTLDGADEYVFGDVTAIAPDGVGGFYVFDRQVPAVRHYDHEGRFVKILGGEGEGPGEYSAGIDGMALRHDGRFMVHDVQNGRIALYEADGTPSDHWRATSSLFGSLFVGQSLLVDSLDHTYVKILTNAFRPGMPWPWPIGLLHLDQRGQVVDTIQPPSGKGEHERLPGPLTPTMVWTLHGYTTVVGFSDTYSFEIRKPSAKVIRVTHAFEPVVLSDDEWRAYEARRMRDIQEEGRGRPKSELPPPTPRTKPAYRAFRIDQDGRIWVHKYMPSVREELESNSDRNEPSPPTFTDQEGFDVFDIDGVYLGQVIVPFHTKLYWLGSDYVLGVDRGRFDEQYVVRLRLTTPA